MSNFSKSDFTLLVVDDDPVCRELLGAALKANGLRATCVADGPAALNLLDRQEFGMIILDNEMPGISGLDLLKKLRADSRYRNTPVLILTVTTDKSIVMDAIKLGVCGYISKKSFSLEKIMAKIQTILDHAATPSSPAQNAKENLEEFAAANSENSQVERLSRAILGPETPPAPSQSPPPDEDIKSTAA